jgi:hypothetical protein
MIRGVLGSWKERDPPPGGRGGSEREREREREREKREADFLLRQEEGGKLSWAGGRERERERDGSVCLCVD